MRARAWLPLLFVCVACDGDEPLPELRVGSACPAEVMRFVNDRFIATHPADEGSADWQRAVYMLGNLAAADVLAEPRYVDYAIAWATEEDVELAGENIHTRNPDNHAGGQAYLRLYERTGDPVYVAAISLALDFIERSLQRDDWSYAEALFLAAPAYVELGELFDQPRYIDAMFQLYTFARDRRHLYDAAEGLWFRDEEFLFSRERTDRGRKVFWSRANGMAIAAHARVLQLLDADSPFRRDFEDVLVAMAAALARVQRDDGFWNVSLADDEDHPGPETSGTAFITYGIALGVNEGLLDRATYLPVVEKAWRGMVSTAVRADGVIGFVQGPGDEPEDDQPVTLRSARDYGTGAFLLAGSEMSRLGIDLGCP